jgi:glucose-1-phosphate adenylyltransferase
MKAHGISRVVSELTRATMAVIMAGGRGERLKQLTDKRAKPATPFGGKYRIIDFTLSNCVNSGIRQILVLTQYKAHSLIQHVQRGWGFLHGELGEFIDLVPAQQKLGEWWYRGTADAVYQNMDIIEERGAETVLVLAGDHVYKMDYGPMIAFHKERGADITIGGAQVPLGEAREFGVMTVDESGRVISFDEKPTEPGPMPGREGIALVSMGIYVFDVKFLKERLREDAERADSAHDFGKNIIPESVSRHRLFAYPFEDVETNAQAYWRDVGTVDAYYEANLELVHVSPELNLYDRAWPIWTSAQREVRVGRRGAARRRRELDDCRRLYRIGRCRSRVPTVLQRPRWRAVRDTSIRAAAGREHWTRLSDQQCHHRRRLRRARWLRNRR